jgi:hypothetical protein
MATARNSFSQKTQMHVFPSVYGVNFSLGGTIFSAIDGTLIPARLQLSKTLRILLANLLQSSRSTFSWGSFLSFFAFKAGMLDTPISALGG